MANPYEVLINALLAARDKEGRDRRYEVSVPMVTQMVEMMVARARMYPSLSVEEIVDDAVDTLDVRRVLAYVAAPSAAQAPAMPAYSVPDTARGQIPTPARRPIARPAAAPVAARSWAGENTEIETISVGGALAGRAAPLDDDPYGPGPGEVGYTGSDTPEAGDIAPYGRAAAPPSQPHDPTASALNPDWDLLI